MRNLIKFLWLGLFLMLTACGGGGSKSTAPSSSAQLNKNVVLQEEVDLIESITGTQGSTGEIILDAGAAKPIGWKVDKIVLFPPSKEIPDGLAIKIKNIRTENGKTKVTYTPPAIDELFLSATVKSKKRLQAKMIKSFRGISGVKMSTQVVRKPSGSKLAKKNLSKINSSDYEFFPTFGGVKGELSGSDGDFIKSLKFDLNNVVIVRSLDRNQALTLSGGIELSDVSIDYEFDIKENQLGLPDINTFKSGAQLNYQQKTNLDIEAELLDIDLNMTDIPEVRERFVCSEGNRYEYDADYLTVTIEGAQWPSNDVCIGAVTLSLDGFNVKTGNGGILNLKPSLDLYMIIGMDLKVSIKASYNFSSTSDKKLGAWLNMNKSDSPLTIIKDSVETSRTNLIQGEINGHFEHNLGAAFALNLAGIKPVVVRGFAKVDANATEKIRYGAGTNSIYCHSGNIDFGIGYSAHLGVSARIDLQNVPNWLKKIDGELGISYNHEDETPAFFHSGYDSCAPDTVSFTIDQEKNTGQIKVGDLALTDTSGNPRAISTATWSLYNTAPFELIETYNQPDLVINDLLNGSYTLYLKVVSDTGEELVIVRDFEQNITDVAAPVITLNGDNPYVMIIDTDFTDPGATATDNIDNNVTVTATGSVNTGVADSYTITYKATDNAGNTATKTRTVNVITGVVDTVAPVITLNGANPMSVVKGDVFTDFGATATDNLDGNVAVVSTGSVNTTIAGEYTITYTATDSDNNTSTKTRIVNVIEPTVVVTPPQNVQATAGDQKVTLTWDAVAGADSYAAYWHDASGVTTSNYLDKKIVLGNSAEVTGLVNDKSYYFVVTAFKGTIEGVASIEKNSIPHASSDWIKEATPPWSARGYHASVVFKNKIWVIGGDNDSGYEKDVWSSLDGISWIKVTDSAPWPHLVTSASIVFNNKIWVFADDSVLVDGSYRSGIWSTSDGVSWVRERLAPWTVKQSYRSVVFNNKIWVFGDIYGSDIWSSPDGQVWTKVATAPWLARLHSAVVFKNKMWVLGGSDYNRNTNDVWSSSNGVNWTKVVAAPWSERSMHSSVVFDNKIWVLGGASSEYGLKNDVWSSSDGVSWTEEAIASWTARYAHRSLVYNNKIWVIGGRRADNDGGYINDVWSLSNGSVSEIPDEIKVINEKLVIDSQLTQELSNSGKNSITNWVAIKDPVNGIKHNGEIVTSFSGDMILSSNAMTRGGGSDGTDGNKLRTGFNMSLYDKNDPNKILTIFLRVKQGKGFLSGLQYNSIFAEYADYSQSLIREFPLDNTDGGIGPAKDSCIVSELRTTGQNFLISRDQSASSDRVTVSCGSKSGYFDLESISDSLDGEGIIFNPSDYIVGRVAVRTKMSNATVGSKITAKFDNIKLNGELVDDFLSGQLNTTLWNYVQHYTK